MPFSTNSLIVYLHVFAMYIKKYLHVITSAIHFCKYIYNYTIDPFLTPVILKSIWLARSTFLQILAPTLIKLTYL